MTEELARFLERTGLALLDLADRVKTSPEIDAQPIIFLAVDILNAAMAMERAALADDKTEPLAVRLH